MKKYFSALFVTLSALFAAGATQAQSSPWYVGVSAGQSRVSIDSDVLPVNNDTGSSLSKNETDTAYKLFAGYRFTRNLAVEAGYTDFGKFTVTRSVNATPADTGRGEVKSSGFFVDAVGILPLNNSFDLFGKVGAIYTTTKTDITTTGGFTPLSSDLNPKKSETNLQAGIGGEYHFNKQFGVRLEYERTFDVGEKNTTGESDIDVVTLGVVYRY